MMRHDPHELFWRKLSAIAALTDAEQAGIRGLPIHTRSFPAKTDVVSERQRPSQCCLVIDGIMMRYKVISTGQRQIVNLHLPGDIPDLQSLHLNVMDHHLAALTAVTVGMIPHGSIHDLNTRFPRLAGALWRVTLIDAALLRERVVSLGQRSAVFRLAHLLCETFVRLKSMGQTDGDRMYLPITQVELADMLGMSTVHMNRTIQDLRSRGLVVTDRDLVVLPDFDRLAKLAGFDPLYLHLAPHDRPAPP